MAVDLRVGSKYRIGKKIGSGSFGEFEVSWSFEEGVVRGAVWCRWERMAKLSCIIDTVHALP
jgi:hypothetical protein